MTKKRHHYLPQAYLKSFCDKKGRICLYRKDNPRGMVCTSLDRVCVRKFYYSQPVPGGGKDHNKLEDLFSSYEMKWPGIVARLGQRENVNDCVRDIFAFIALQRVRVPAARDASEAMLAESVRATLRVLDAAGRLRANPEGHEDLLEHPDVPIDPHQSIHAMVPMIRGIGDLLQRIGIGALHNRTNIPFLTSDNPVIWFDPDVAEDEMRPYTVQKGGPIVLLFPVTPKLMIYGHSSKREQFAQYGFGYGELSDCSTVKTMNLRICQFAYEAVLAQEPGQEDLIRRYAGISPVIQTQTIPVENGKFLTLPKYEWGRRNRKPKWEGRGSGPDTKRGTQKARPDAL